MPPVDVLTNRYNNQRTGANAAETVLNHSNVNPNAFGKLFTRSVDGQIYAQPLIVSGLTVAGHGLVDVVYVCTTRNNVYAFNALDPAAGIPLWQVNVGPSVPPGDFSSVYKDFSNEIGITGTPVIDRMSSTIYFAAKTKIDPARDASGKITAATYVYSLHALDLVTGAAKPNSPAIIAKTRVNDLFHFDKATDFTFISGPSVSGAGEGSVGGTITLNAFFQHNRAGLLLLDNVVYIAFASHGDKGVYHGWVLAYDATALGLLGVYCTTPNWGEGGIWQSGCGLAGDTPGEVFAIAGNGRNNGHDPSPAQLQSGPFFGQSVIKLNLDRVAKKLSLMDWFVPFDVVSNNQADLDLCAGPVLLPWADLLGAFGKDRAYYILDRGNLGKFTNGSNAIFQFAPDMTSPLNKPGDPVGGTGHIHCAPIVFDHPTLGPISYVWGENDDLRGYPFDGETEKFATQTPANLRSSTAVPVGMPGGMLAVSSDGVDASSAIVWAAHPADENANNKTVAGVLQAFAADDLTAPIWRSNHDPTGVDDVGNFAKFCTPVVANGMVYMATFSNELAVFGLLPGGVPQQTIGPWSQADVPPPLPPGGLPLPADDPLLFRVEGSASFSCNRFTILGSGHDIWGNADGFHYVYQQVATGAMTITARIVEMTKDISSWSKAGIMVRATLDADSVNAMVAVTPAKGVVFQYRQTEGGPTVLAGSVNLVGAAAGTGWVRLVQAPAGGGNFSFTGFASVDGIAWQQIGGPVDIPMAAGALAGLAVTAHNDPPSNSPDLDELCLVVIDKVTLN